MFQNYQEADDASGSLSRIRKRRIEVAKELGLTSEQQYKHADNHTHR